MNSHNLAKTLKMLKCKIQQYKGTKQQKETIEHQQFESLEGNFSLPALHPINQPN